MPIASHTVVIDAPRAAVWALLLDKMRAPERYIPGVEASEIRDSGDGFAERWMRLPQFDVLERVLFDEQPGVLTYVLVDHDLYTGEAIDHLEPTERGLELTLGMNWRPRPDREDTFDGAHAVQVTADRIKSLAEGDATSD